VEFDTHQDPWDPSCRHIGINVNRGDYKVLPDGSLVDAGMMSATVVYDNRTRRLDVARLLHHRSDRGFAKIAAGACCYRLLSGDRESVRRQSHSDLLLLPLNVANQERHRLVCFLLLQ
jgi:hypothetical protein